MIRRVRPSWLRSRTSIGSAAVIVLILIPLSGQAHAGQPEACFASGPSTPLTPNPCMYKATVNGGADAVGDWLVVIKRPIKHHRPRTITIDSKRLPASCVPVGPRTICPVGTIKPGDMVTARARSAPTLVGTGNPCPVPNPGLPPPIAGGKC